MSKNRSSAHELAAARAVADWVNKQTPDELGTLVDSIWSLGTAVPGWSPELTESARALMEHNLGGHADPCDPKPLVSLAELLECAARKLHAAARILSEDERRGARAS